MSDEIDLITYIHFSGPAVDALARRKETGSKVEISEPEMRASYDRVKDRLFAGIKCLTRSWTDRHPTPMNAEDRSPPTKGAQQ